MIITQKSLKHNQRAITQKLRTESNSTFTHRLDLVYIPIKFHEGIPNGYGIMGLTRLKIHKA